MFSNVAIMTLDYVVCPISVQNPENEYFEGVYLFPMHQHTETINSTIRQHSCYITSAQQRLKYGLYQGSYDHCEVDRDSDLNRLALVILRYTTVTNQC